MAKTTKKRKPVKKAKKAPDGWLETKDFCAKYAQTLNDVKLWIRAGYLETKFRHPGAGSKGGYYLLDLAPHLHPGWENRQKAVNKKNENRKLEVLASDSNPENTEKRKELLKTKYLPRLIKYFELHPGKANFTATEVKEALGVTNYVMYKQWPSWGLIARTLPTRNPTQQNSDKASDAGGAPINVYTRPELHDFFSGNWDKKGYSTVDDAVISATLGNTAESGFYKYDPNKVYPITADGFLRWVEDKKIMIRNHRTQQPELFRVFPWQKEHVRHVLERKKSNGDLQYRICIASNKRGEGKTVIHCILALFRFFNGYAEKVYMAGNSKEEAGFAHYGLARDIINDTTALKTFPGLKVKEKHIVIYQGEDDILNEMKTIPTSSGLYSGITCAVITELHNFSPEDRKFITNLTSSLRNIPNAQVLVDTTVAGKGHIVEQYWKTFCEGKNPLLWFTHKDDSHGFDNPEMTEEELNHQRTTLSEQEYRRYFRNRWDDAEDNFFTPKAIRQISIAGITTAPVFGKPTFTGPVSYGPSAELTKAVDNLFDLETKRSSLASMHVDKKRIADIQAEIDKANACLIPMDSLYKLPASIEDLERIKSLFGIKGWIIGCGLDRSNMKKDGDRTAFACVARGIIDEFRSYYFLLDLYVPLEATYGFIEDKLREWQSRYFWIDNVVITEFLGLDFSLWCQKEGFSSEYVHDTYKFQRPRFTQMYHIVENGYFKAPSIPYYTNSEGTVFEGYTTKEDIFIEEMQVFRHQLIGDDRGKFGTPDKRKKGGIKDDTIDAVSVAIYACGAEGLEEIATGRDLKGGGTMGMGYVENKDCLGDYN